MKFLNVDWIILATGVAIFFARIIDVSLGTLRTISIVQGRKWMAFCLGFFEIILWLSVISTVVHKIKEAPILGIFFAFGFATGNLVGIQIERWLALGYVILKVISKKYFTKMSRCIREAGYAVTTFQGEGKDGPVVELYIVCRRQDLKRILLLVKDIEPSAFYIIEHAGSASKIYRPILQQPTGWRSILKKK